MNREGLSTGDRGRMGASTEPQEIAMPRPKSVPPTPRWVDPAAKAVRGLRGMAHDAAVLADLPLEQPDPRRPAPPRADDNNPNVGG